MYATDTPGTSSLRGFVWSWCVRAGIGYVSIHIHTTADTESRKWLSVSVCVCVFFASVRIQLHTQAHVGQFIQTHTYKNARRTASDRVCVVCLNRMNMCDKLCSCYAVTIAVSVHSECRLWAASARQSGDIVAHWLSHTCDVCRHATLLRHTAPRQLPGVSLASAACFHSGRFLWDGVARLRAHQKWSWQFPRAISHAEIFRAPQHLSWRRLSSRLVSVHSWASDRDCFLGISNALLCWLKSE